MIEYPIKSSATAPGGDSNPFLSNFKFQLDETNFPPTYIQTETWLNTS